MRPAGPVPDIPERSTPSSWATFFANGEALMRSPSDDGVVGAGASAVSGSVSSSSSRSFFPPVVSSEADFSVEVSLAGAEEPSPSALSPSSTARIPPISTLSPSCTRISVIVPSSNASISMVALSVSTSARMSPISTLSPTCLCHLMRVPSVMVSESLGISIFTDMIWGKLVCRRREWWNEA